jgi:hypothetical protein
MNKLKYVKTFEGLFSSGTLKDNIQKKLKQNKLDITVEGDEESGLIIKGQDRKLIITKNEKLYNVDCEFKSSNIKQNQKVREVKASVIPDFVAEFMEPEHRNIGGVVKQLFQTKNSSFFGRILGIN